MIVQNTPQTLAIFGAVLLAIGALRAMDLRWRWALLPFWLLLLAGILMPMFSGH